MSKDPLAEAERIASVLQGAPTAIRRVRVPQIKTGLTTNANIMGANLALMMMKSRRKDCDTVSFHSKRLRQPQEAIDGLSELHDWGFVRSGSRSTVWTDICMDNHTHRNMFINWDGDHQNRVSNRWEDFWHDGIVRRYIVVK